MNYLRTEHYANCGAPRCQHLAQMLRWAHERIEAAEAENQRLRESLHDERLVGATRSLAERPYSPEVPDDPSPQSHMGSPWSAAGGPLSDHERKPA